jgi:hypothetical protein
VISKSYCVVLTDGGLAELESTLRDYLSEGAAGKYLYCKEASADRNYFHVVAEGVKSDGSKADSEIFIPHRFIKLVISSTDRAHIGFL